MKISSINNQTRSSFGAIVNYQNKRLTKKPPCCETELENCGEKNTVINVTDFEKFHSPKGRYIMRFFLQSNIFGNNGPYTVAFNSEVNTRSQEEYSPSDIIYDFFTRNNGEKCVEHENKALQKNLLKQVINSAKRNSRHYNNRTLRESTKAADKLDGILDTKTIREEGLSPDRLVELRIIAEKLDDEIAIKGVENIAKKEFIGDYEDICNQ